MINIITESLEAVYIPYIYKNEKIYTKVDSICDAMKQEQKK